MTDDEVKGVLAAGAALVELDRQEADGREPPVTPGSWFLICGRILSDAGASTDHRVKEALTVALGYPLPAATRPELTINLVVDSPGGNVDSAYKSVLWLRAYTDQLNVYVPRRAKSAATLLAIGADQIYLSPFAELGPLDTQIPDPRNPANTVSALDCYQSVEYVRRFGFATMTEVLGRLVQETEGRIPLKDLLETSSRFALGSITPMMESVKALDFGGWGRSLRIGQKYAQKLLLSNNVDPERAADIAGRLVYGYTHHPFPIDYVEALDLRLPVKLMDEAVYVRTLEAVQACRDKSYVGFLSQAQAGPVGQALVESHRSQLAERLSALEAGDEDGPVGEVGHDD